MSVPTDFSSLTPQEQVFVLANLERVDRGLPPIEGLATSLDGLAQTGAQTDDDPAFPSNTEKGGSNWANGNIFTAYGLWMYEDGWSGPGSINEACTSPTAPGCWGHRDNILGTYPSPTLMGAGITTTSTDGASVDELFVGGDTSDTPYFTWSRVAPTLPVGVSTLSISDAAATGATATTSVELWASGEAMKVGTAITGGTGAFSVNPAGCDLSAGASCQVSVQFAPNSMGNSNATLAVTGPNGTQDVTLQGVASASTTTSSSTTTTSTTAPSTTTTTSTTSPTTTTTSTSPISTTPSG